MGNLHTIIVSLPGAWRRALRENIEVYSFVKVVGVVSGSLAASNLTNRLQPEVMLIDSSVPFDDSAALVQNLKQNNLKTKIIVITDTTQQRREITQAGADYALLSFNFESQIGEILHQAKRAIPELESDLAKTNDKEVSPDLNEQPSNTIRRI